MFTPAYRACVESATNGVHEYESRLIKVNSRGGVMAKREHFGDSRCGGCWIRDVVRAVRIWTCRVSTRPRPSLFVGHMFMTRPSDSRQARTSRNTVCSEDGYGVFHEGFGMLHRVFSAGLAAALLTILAAASAAAMPAPGKLLTVVSAACVAGTAGDIDGNGVGDLVVEARRYGPTQTQFDVLRYPDGQRASIGLADVDPAAEAGLWIRDMALGDLDGDGCAEAVFVGDLPDPNHTPLNLYQYKPRLYVVPGSPDGLNLAGTVRIDLPGGGARHVAVLPATRQIAVTTTAQSGGTLLVHTLGVGLTAGTTWQVTAKDLGIASGGRADFGVALSASGHTIAVGNPGQALGIYADAGAVFLFSSPTMTHVRLTQRTKGMPKASPYGQRFGASVAYLDGRLAIGAPGAQIGDHYAAGRVNLVLWNETKRTYKVLRSFNQDSRHVTGIARSWDILGSEVLIARGLTGSGSYDVVAGARLDQLGTTKGAGSITVTNFHRSGYQLITQNTPGVPGSVAKSRQFGATLGLRHLTSASDSILTTSYQTDPDCKEASMLMQTAAAPIQTTTWNLVSPRDDAVGCAQTWTYTISR